jgi:hypothetical protein
MTAADIALLKPRSPAQWNENKVTSAADFARGDAGDASLA